MDSTETAEPIETGASEEPEARPTIQESLDNLLGGRMPSDLSVAERKRFIDHVATETGEPHQKVWSAWFVINKRRR